VLPKSAPIRRAMSKHDTIRPIECANRETQHSEAVSQLAGSSIEIRGDVASDRFG
jgi:hypothetical protein